MGSGVNDFDSEPESENPSMKAAREKAEKAEQRAKREKKIAKQEKKEAQAKAEKAQKARNEANREKNRAIKEQKEAEEKVKMAEKAEIEACIQIVRAREEKEGALEKAEKAKDAEEQAKKQREEIEREIEAVKEQTDQMMKEAREEIATAKRGKEEANKQKYEAERDRDDFKNKADMLAKGVEPSYQPTLKDIENAKRRIEFQPDKFHIAIAGSSGSGKSSLINSFRAISNRSKHAAATGTTETTTKMGRYPDPATELPFKRFIWYDIPGAGTQSVNLRQYAKTQALYVFDVVILVYGGRLLESDITTLRNCVEFGVPTFLVRSRADEQVRNLQDELDALSDDDESCEAHAPMTKTPEQLFEEDTRKNLGDELKTANLPPQEVYIVSKEAVRWICKYIRKQEGLASTRKAQTSAVETTEAEENFWMTKAKELAVKAKEGIRAATETLSVPPKLYQAPELVLAVLVELYRRRYNTEDKGVNEPFHVEKSEEEGQLTPVDSEYEYVGGNDF